MDRLESLEAGEYAYVKAGGNQLVGDDTWQAMQLGGDDAFHL